MLSCSQIALWEKYSTWWHKDIDYKTVLANRGAREQPKKARVFYAACALSSAAPGNDVYESRVVDPGSWDDADPQVQAASCDTDHGDWDAPDEPRVPQRDQKSKSTNRNQAARVAESLPRPTPGQCEAKEVDKVSSASIVVQRWDPKTPYLAELKECQNIDK
jgi:hypothetical protein